MSTSRRGLLKGLVGVGAGAAATSGLPGCAPDLEPAPLVDTEAPVNGKLALKVGRYPSLSKPGGAVTLRVPGKPRLLAVHPGGDEYAVLDATCTHVGCPLGFDRGEVACPCHGARFDVQGQVLAPPAKVGLKAYSARYEALTDTLTIDFGAGDATFPAAVNGEVFLSFSQFPQLRTAGGVVSGTPGGHGRLLFVFALEGGAYAAVDSVCTHAGCTVGFQDSAKLLVCPCHNAAFAPSGNIVREAEPGSGQADLLKFTATASADGVTVRVA